MVATLDGQPREADRPALRALRLTEMRRDREGVSGLVVTGIVVVVVGEDMKSAFWSTGDTSGIAFDCCGLKSTQT